MTKDEIDYWNACLYTVGYDLRELCDQAKRALLLEDVLAAAKELTESRARIGAPLGKLEATLRAAIDRAEGK